MINYSDVKKKVEDLFKQYADYEEGTHEITTINSVDYIKIIVALELEYDFEFYDDDLADDRFDGISALTDYVYDRVKYKV